MSSGASTSFELFDQIPLGICVLGAGLEVRYWNACLEDWTGIDRHQIVSTVISERFAHLGAPPYSPRLQAVLQGGPPTVFSSQLHPHLIPAELPDGRLRIQHTVVTSIPDRDGFDALMSIQDVTDLTRRIEDYRELRDRAVQEVRERQRAEAERRKIEARMMQAQKVESLGVLAGGIAHDFNNLLVGILGNAELVLSDLPSHSESRRLVTAVIEAAQRAAELSGQMLSYSGKGRFRAVRLDLSEHVREMEPLFKSSISKKADLSFQLEDVPAIDADPAQIQQIAVNLVTNASDALEEANGQIKLVVDQTHCDPDRLRETFLGADLAAGEYVALEVSDTGIGMDEITREKIFDPFFSTKFAGRGLGLAAVLGIVRRHRGALEVETSPGFGTTVRVLFPQSAEPTPVRASEVAVASAKARGTVLIVDDEEMVRMLAQTALERSGLEVLTAGDGREGLEVFRANADQISAVLLDMAMPRLGGEETYHELCRIRPDVRVIFSSGYDDQTEHLTEVAFIQKPYRPGDLVAKVREVLDG